MTPIRVLVAPDAFKSSITAADAARHLAAGIAAGPGCTVVQCPIADGGEGTVAVLAGLGAALHHVQVTGPLGNTVQASWAALEGTAYVEAAQGSGAQHVPLKNVETCLAASSVGVGELIIAALDAGHRRIVLTTGGSAVSDGGAGMLSALGARFFPPEAGTEGGGSLLAVRAVELSTLDPRLATTELTVAVDVGNPLIGPEGTARTFAPQKGAGTAETEILEGALVHWASLLSGGIRQRAREAGAGASGGIGFAAMTALDANMVRGADLVLDLLGFDRLLPKADLVVTGEGSFDRQTLSGKGPLVLAQRARRLRIPAVVVAGRVELSRAELEKHGIWDSWSLQILSGSPRSALADPGPWLEEAGRQIAAEAPRLVDAPH